MIRSLPPEERERARRLTNQELAEHVRGLHGEEAVEDSAPVADSVPVEEAEDRPPVEVEEPMTITLPPKKAPGQGGGGQSLGVSGLERGKKPDSVDVDPDAKVPVVTAQPRFKGKNLWELMKGDDRKDLRRQLSGVYTNKNTGWAIRVARNGIDHAISSAKNSLDGVAHMEAVANLPALIENAVLVESHEDRKKQGLKAVHRMYVPMRIGTSLFTVKLTVKESAEGMVAEIEDMRRLYDVSLARKMPGDSRQTPDSEMSDGSSGSTPGTSTITLRQLLEGVNDQKRTPLWEGAQSNHSTSGTPDAVSGQSGVRKNVDASSSEGKADQRQDSEPHASAGKKAGRAKQGTAPRIEDFGEKIGGARKDIWQGLHAILDDATVEDIARQPLERVFPAQNYNKLLAEGMDPKLVALTHAVRDHVAAHKREMRTRPHMASEMKRLLDGYRKLLAGEITLQQFHKEIASIDKIAAKIIRDAADLYEAVGHSNLLADVRIFWGSRSMYTVEKAAKGTALSNWPQVLARGKTRDEAIAAFKKKFDGMEWGKPREEKGPSLSIYYRSDNPELIFIGKKIGRDFVDLAGPFASSEEAEAYRREHENELAEKLAKMRELPSERRADNAPRVGEDLRNGRDVTPEMFSEAFGFRGVEFGNWVGNEQRQTDLNNAFDALTDLAGVLGISSRAISLNGELGLAFGARGRGGKYPQNAHYETRRVVINLTRTRGAGSLAHEWLHALDNYFSRMRGKNFAEEYLSDNPGVEQASLGEEPVYIHKTPRQEIIEAWGLVRKTIRESGMKERSDALDRLRTKPYWGTDVEMTARAFERYIIEKLRGRKASNDYLANIRSEEEWKAASGDRSYPYPTSDEMPAITAAFDNLFETIEERQTDRGVALASIAPGEHLPPAGNARRGMRTNVLRRLVDRLSGIAGKAATTRVVQHFDELPAHVREEYGDAGTTLEGVFDPVTGTVWLVADNLSDAGRAAEVWTHEQLAHHGLRSLLSGAELGDLLKKVWFMSGGMKNPLVADIAERYGLKPLNNVRDRLRVAEEVVGKLAEKRGRGLLTRAEGGMWRKVVEAVRRAWHRMIEAVTGRPSIMDARNIDALLTALERHVMDGTEARGAASGLNGMKAEHAAWRQAQDDMEAWGRQVDDFDPTVVIRGGKTENLTVGRTPDVLRKLGAPDLPMTMSARNLAKILSDKEDHNLPEELVKQLPMSMADPIMVFESATSPDSLVVLTELRHENHSVMVAVHLDTQRQNIRVNDIASAYKRGNEAWYARQIEEGRLLYQNKGKSLAWARTHGLQLPKVRRLPSRLSEGRILTEADVVKPVAPEKIADDTTPLASLSPSGILGMGVKAAAGAAKAPEIRHFFGSGDLTILQNILQLPHWIAKRHRAFARVYERQLKRMDERAAALKKSLESVPSLFGGKRLKPADMDSLREMLWAHEGKVQKELEGIEKFLTEDFLETGHETIMVNPRFYDAYRDWLDSSKATPKARQARQRITGCGQVSPRQCSKAILFSFAVKNNCHLSRIRLSLFTNQSIRNSSLARIVWGFCCKLRVYCWWGGWSPSGRMALYSGHCWWVWPCAPWRTWFCGWRSGESRPSCRPLPTTCAAREAPCRKAAGWSACAGSWRICMPPGSRLRRLRKPRPATCATRSRTCGPNWPRRASMSGKWPTSWRRARPCWTRLTASATNCPWTCAICRNWSRMWTREWKCSACVWVKLARPWSAWPRPRRSLPSVCAKCRTMPKPRAAKPLPAKRKCAARWLPLKRSRVPFCISRKLWPGWAKRPVTSARS